MRVRVARWSRRVSKLWATSPELVCCRDSFLFGLWGALGFGDRVGGVVGWCLVGEGDWRPRSAEMENQVGGEHADEHLGTDSCFEPMVDGTELEVDGFERPELGFDETKPFVGFDHFTRVELVGLDAGSYHVDAVEGCFGVDGGLVVLVGEGAFCDNQVVVFAHSVFVVTTPGQTSSLYSCCVNRCLSQCTRAIGSGTRPRLSSLAWLIKSSLDSIAMSHRLFMQNYS